LPISQRRDALRIIKDNKGKYLDLLKMDVDIANNIKEKALENLYDDTKLQYMEEHASYLKLRNEVNNGIYDDTASAVPTEIHDLVVGTHCGCCAYWNDYFNGICKKKFDGRKTSLSNILLTIMMEEEKTERDKRVAKLMKIKTEKNRVCGDNFIVGTVPVDSGDIVEIKAERRESGLEQHFHLSDPVNLNV
jgi:hypothetical protein